MRFKINDIIILKKGKPHEMVPHRIIKIEQTESSLKCYMCEPAKGKDYYLDGHQYKFLVVDIVDKIYELDIKILRKLKLTQLEKVW